MVNYWNLFVWAMLRARKGRMLNVGDTAPPFSVPDDTGALRRLEDFHGKVLVLWFYPKADTPG